MLLNKRHCISAAVCSVVAYSGSVWAEPIDIELFKDTFDITHANGQAMKNSSVEVGLRWTEVAGTPSPLQNFTTNERSNPPGGLCFKQVRENQGAAAVITRSDPGDPKNLTLANQTYTVKFDVYTLEDSDMFTFIWGPDNNPGAGVEFDMINGTYRSYNPNTGTFTNSGVENGSGAWNSVELEIHNGALDGSGLYPVSYDLYLTRGEGGTKSAMPRTLVMSGTHPILRAPGEVVSLYLGAASGADTMYYDNVVIGIGGPKWGVDSSGTWSNATNWQSGVPNAVDARANFGSVITANRTVFVDGNQTAGIIRFDNSAASYTIAEAAGGGTLTLDVTSGEAGINVLSGSHTISAPIVLNDDATITVTPSSSTLVLSGEVNAAGRVLTKAGAGTAQFQNVRASSLSVTGGAVKISSKGAPASASGTSVVSSLSLDPSAKLDLTNNAMVVDYGFISPSSIRTALVAGYNNGAWTGNGIMSSSAAANGLTAVGYAEASDLFSSFPGSFAGQSVDATSVLIRYTLGGDANLDGVVNSQDFNLLIAHYGQSNARWSYGDFDYSGKVNSLDFNRLAGTFGATLPVGAASLGSVVPEPASASLLITAAAMLLRRNRISAR